MWKVTKQEILNYSKAPNTPLLTHAKCLRERHLLRENFRSYYPKKKL